MPALFCHSCSRRCAPALAGAHPAERQLHASFSFSRCCLILAADGLATRITAARQKECHGIYFHTDDPAAERRSRELVSVCGRELTLRAAFRDLRCNNQRCQSSSALLNSSWDLWPENLVQLWKAAAIMWWLCPTVDFTFVDEESLIHLHHGCKNANINHNLISISI